MREAVDIASSCSTTASVAVCCCKACTSYDKCIPCTCTRVRAHAQKHTESLHPVYPLHAAKLLYYCSCIVIYTSSLYVCAHVSYVRMRDKILPKKLARIRRAVIFVVDSHKSRVGFG